MNISGIGAQNPQSLASSTTGTKAGESLQQAAAQGDPKAMAELQEQKMLEPQTTTGPDEPGKGEQVDQYI